MISLEDISDQSSDRIIMETGFEVCQPIANETTSLTQVSVCSNVSTDESDRNCRMDGRSPSPKRSRIESILQNQSQQPSQHHQPPTTLTLLGGEQHQQHHQLSSNGNGDIGTFTETYPYLPSHSEGSSLAYASSYDDIGGGGSDIYGMMSQGNAVSCVNFTPISMASGSSSGISESSPGSRSDSGLSMDHSPSQNGYNVLYGYSSPSTSSNGSSGIVAINYDKYSPDKSNLYVENNNSSAIVSNQQGTQYGNALNYSSPACDDRRRYLKTVDFLKKANLFDVTMKTADLMKRNHALQKEMDTLKADVTRFLNTADETNACI